MHVEFIKIEKGQYEVELRIQKTGLDKATGEAHKPTAHANLGTVTRDTITTELGPVECWVFKPGAFGDLEPLRRKTFGLIKDAIESELFERALLPSVGRIGESVAPKMPR